MVKYVVTGHVKSLGRRDTLSKPMSRSAADAYKKRTDADMKTATKAYKWVKDTKVERVNPT